MHPGSIRLCREERGKQMLKSKKSENVLVNGSQWATRDIFIGKAERNPDRFGRLVDFFFSRLFLCSSLFIHSPLPEGPAINWLNHKRSLGRCWLSSLHLPPLSVGLKMMAAMKNRSVLEHRKESKTISPREREKYEASIYNLGEGNGNPLQYSCLENTMDGGAWEAAVHGVAKSRTRLSDFTFTFHFQALEKEMATHSSILAWRTPGTGEPWWAAVHGVAESQTRLKRFSSSSSIYNLTIDPENFHNHLQISCHLWPSLLQALWEVNQESQCVSWCSSLSVDCSISPFLPCFWRWGLCKINEVDFATTYTWIWTPSSNICYLCGLAS